MAAGWPRVGLQTADCCEVTDGERLDDDEWSEGSCGDDLTQ